MRMQTVFSGPELCRKQAHEVIALLKSGDISPQDCLDAAFTRIADVEPAINAMPTLRRSFIREAAGLTGDLPKLLQGRQI